MQGMSMQEPVTLLANTLFSETKDINDAKNIASVIINRTKRPERFGATVQDVVLQPHQFSGVGGNEWNKAETGNLNPEEANIYKKFLSIAHQAVKGTLKDDTDGADHYFNPKIVKPKWAIKMKKTTETKFHSYYKE